MLQNCDSPRLAVVTLRAVNLGRELTGSHSIIYAAVQRRTRAGAGEVAVRSVGGRRREAARRKGEAEHQHENDEGLLHNITSFLL